MNILLEGTTSAYYTGTLKRMEAQRPASLSGLEWRSFKPARSKIEAVNRISHLIGCGPEDLGPGSKERKRVLVNLASRLVPDLDTTMSKTRLAAAIAAELNAPWSDMCESTGETISLVGLNTLLAGAERRLGHLGASAAETLGTPEAEGAALAAALVDKLDRDTWDARETVLRMVREGIPGSRQSEWQGFYFEGRGRQILNAAFSPLQHPVRARYGHTAFDYSLNFVWDLKAHTEAWRRPNSEFRAQGRPDVQLNDERAIRECVADQGLGFLMLSGEGLEDVNGEFATWHASFKGRTEPQRRRLKAGFSPLQIEAYWIPDTASLLGALAAGVLRVSSQGRQPDGRPRNTKIHLATSKARGVIDVSRVSF